MKALECQLIYLLCLLHHHQDKIMNTSSSNILAQATNPIDLGGFRPPTDAYSEGSATSPESAASNLELFVSNIVGFMTVLAALFFIIQFVIAAFSWVSSGGDSSKVQKARDKMIQGVLGLIIIVAAYSIIGLIGTIIGLDLINIGDQIINLDPLATP